ncbi:hypothetical protein IW492_11445 [Enterococcus sp. BWB1-3]|uniref:hypothetical protein n=1 Tax=Enterococcus sp. BWB1-3 TaxID=2787713 RepID=UPI00192387C7|nr:hypothetical protein [Enterococcus sp. BWB1-3]MBL1229846.1 hypothetical protein [Enterococcus sp. BWB1-3]
MIFYQLKPKEIQTDILTFNYLPESYRDIEFQEGIRVTVESLNSEVITDYFSKPFPIVSDLFVNTIGIYVDFLPKKFVSLSDGKTDQILTYWALKPKVIDCLYPDRINEGNQKNEKIILSEKMIQNEKFFSVKGLQEESWIVSLDVMESLLRRHLNGFTGEKVTVMS